MSAELVSLAGVRWYAPHVPGKGWPIFRDPMPPNERRCVAAYSTAAKCKAALAYYPEGVELREVAATVFHAERVASGITVIVDLVFDGAASSYQTFPVAVLSPGGEA